MKFNNIDEVFKKQCTKYYGYNLDDFNFRWNSTEGEMFYTFKNMMPDEDRLADDVHYDIDW